MAADSEDFEEFLRQRHAAGGEYVSGNPEPLGRVVAQEFPATFFSPRGDVTSGTREVWSRYERDASFFASGSVNTFEPLDSAAATILPTGLASSDPKRTCAAKINRCRSTCE